MQVINFLRKLLLKLSILCSFVCFVMISRYDALDRPWKLVAFFLPLCWLAIMLYANDNSDD